MEIIVLSSTRWKEYKDLRLESLQQEPQAFGTSYKEALQEPDEKWKTILRNAEIEDKDILYFAQYEEKLVGIMGAFFHKTPETQNIGMIYGAYINKAYRGKGIGRQLLGKIIEGLRAIPDIKKARLMVSMTEEPAKKLYESMGFQIVETTDWKLGDGNTHKLYIMEKEL